MLGATRAAEAASGTIRGDFGLMTGRNLIHGSDSPDTADLEVNLFFRPDELVSWQRNLDPWIYE
jgi:nucleoside-diphosphate kinase